MTYKKISTILVVLLAIIAAIVATGLLAGYSMWALIVIYWAVLTIKNVIDILGIKKEKEGHWIPDDSGIYTENRDTWECSVCGEPFTLFDGTPEENYYNFCPMCGAKMIHNKCE